MKLDEVKFFSCIRLTTRGDVSATPVREASTRLKVTLLAVSWVCACGHQDQQYTNVCRRRRSESGVSLFTMLRNKPADTHAVFPNLAVESVRGKKVTGYRGTKVAAKEAL